jgi:hypothetical protein
MSESYERRKAASLAKALQALWRPEKHGENRRRWLASSEM